MKHSIKDRASTTSSESAKRRWCEWKWTMYTLYKLDFFNQANMIHIVRVQSS